MFCFNNNSVIYRQIMLIVTGMQCKLRRSWHNNYKAFSSLNVFEKGKGKRCYNNQWINHSINQSQTLSGTCIIWSQAESNSGIKLEHPALLNREFPLNTNKHFWLRLKKSILLEMCISFREKISQTVFGSQLRFFNQIVNKNVNKNINNNRVITSSTKT